jgi:hypothetical protein
MVVALGVIGQHFQQPNYDARRAPGTMERGEFFLNILRIRGRAEAGIGS